VIIVIDVLRADHLASYGYPQETAPFLSELAQRSILFRHVHASSSWTAPATASLFTSLYPFQHHVITGLQESSERKIDLNQIPDGCETLGELFQRHGYQTFAVTDNPNICAKLGFDRGFDHFENFSYETAARVNQQVKDWQELLDESPRSLLYLHYMDPHYPYRRREPWYKDQQGKRLKEISAYDSEIRFVDEHIRELFDLLNWRTNTTLVITSDHGEEFGEHGGNYHGHTLFAEVLDVPLLLYSPARWPEAQVISERVSSVDLLPTLANLLGGNLETPHVGRVRRAWKTCRSAFSIAAAV
jgi:arylsulfatase A-like enzyme